MYNIFDSIHTCTHTKRGGSQSLLVVLSWSVTKRDANAQRSRSGVRHFFILVPEYLFVLCTIRSGI